MTGAAEPLAAYHDVRALVIGATGFIGQAIAGALDQSGAEVWLAGRDAKSLDECGRRVTGARILVADLSRTGEFARVYREARPAVVFNLAGYGVDRDERDPVLAAALNTNLVGEIAEALAQDRAGSWPGTRLVHAGSAFEYGPVAGPVTEESPAAPQSDYGRTKLAGARLVLHARESRGLTAVVARLFVVYGPGEHPGRLLPSLVRIAERGEKLKLTAGQQRRDFTYVGDVAEGLLRLGLARECPGVVNLATGRQTSVREFAECAAELLGLAPGQLQFGALPYRDDEVAQGPADTTRIARLLGWTPRTAVREGIRKTIRMHAQTQTGTGKGTAG